MFASCYPAALASNTAHRLQRLSALRAWWGSVQCRNTAQNNTGQKERQFLTSVPTRAPCVRATTKRAFAAEDSEGPPGEFRRRERLRTRRKRGASPLSPRRQREGPWRMRGVRKDFDAYFGTREILGARIRAARGLRSVEQFRWLLSQRNPFTSCPCRRPGLLQRERRGRGRPWESR